MESEVTIILDKPQMGENIGAAARVMANFGIEKLRIISPRDGWPNDKAKNMASFGDYILENAEIYDNFDKALADMNFVIATMGRELTKFSKEIYSSREINKLNYPKLGIVFGCERVGLDNDQLSKCNAIVSINTHSKYQSMNLAQAVAIICYELSTIKDIAEKPSSIQDIAPVQEVSRMIDHLELELRKKNFFQEENKIPKMMRNIRNMFNRNIYSKQEIRTIRGIIRALSKI